MKAYVVVIASTNTRQSKMGCMLRGGSETASCLLYWKKMIGAATSLSPVGWESIPGAFWKFAFHVRPWFAGVGVPVAHFHLPALVNQEGCHQFRIRIGTRQCDVVLEDIAAHSFEMAASHTRPSGPVPARRHMPGSTHPGLEQSIGTVREAFEHPLDFCVVFMIQ